MKHNLLVLALTAAFAAPAQAIPIAQWNFNSSTPDNNTGTGTTSPSIGTGVASLVGGVTGTFASGTANGGSTDPTTTDNSGWQTTTYAAQGTENKLRGVQFAVSTFGWMDIVVSWDQRHSNTAARHAQFQYSTDGTNFVDYGAPFIGNAGDTWFNNRKVDLSGVSAVNNNPNFAFRIVAAFDPNGTGYVASNPTSNYASTGTWRFDMVTVSGNEFVPPPPPPPPIPEPETYALMLAGLGLVGWMAHRRKV